MKPFQAILLSMFVLCSASAMAQWQWIDKDGRKVFSDRAPPGDIAEKNILKRPAGAKPPTVIDSQPPPADKAAIGAVPAAPSASAANGGVDKDLETKKKQAEAAEAAKKKAEEERVAKAKIENCARAKQAKATFDSGVRITRANANGEREVLDDSGRAAEAKRIQGVIDSDCK